MIKLGTRTLHCFTCALIMVCKSVSGQVALPGPPANPAAPDILLASGQPPLAASPLDCEKYPTITMLHALDFGDLRISPNIDGYITVDPRGLAANSASVLVRRDPLPADLAICGTPNKPLTIRINQPTLSLATGAGTSVAKVVKNFTVSGDGVTLQNTAPGQWDGLLGNTGRATIHVGATLLLGAGGNQGVASADIPVAFASVSDTTTLLAVTAVTARPMQVACESNLVFGALTLAPSHGVGQINVAERAGASAIATGSGISVAGVSHPAVCTVTNATAGSVASVTLIGPVQAPGIFRGTTLSSVTLKSASQAALGLSLMASTASLLGSDNPAAGSQVFIGGALQIPSQVEPGIYSETFTIVVTE